MASTRIDILPMRGRQPPTASWSARKLSSSVPSTGALTAWSSPVRQPWSSVSSSSDASRRIRSTADSRRSSSPALCRKARSTSSQLRRPVLSPCTKHRASRE